MSYQLFYENEKVDEVKIPKPAYRKLFKFKNSGKSVHEFLFSCKNFDKKTKRIDLVIESITKIDIVGYETDRFGLKAIYEKTNVSLNQLGKLLDGEKLAFN